LGRIVAIDYGSRRIGLAVADPVTAMPLPWKVLDATGSADADAKTVRQHLSESGEAIDMIVVGLPLNMNGTEGDQAKRTRRFGQAMQNISQIDVEFWDERLSSFTAEQRYNVPEKPGSAKRKRKTRHAKPIDAVAAAVILEEYLAHRRDNGSSTFRPTTR